jgi:O-antigen ligase/polysaccharide polymerase Wzy-like membrane protein
MVVAVLITAAYLERTPRRFKARLENYSLLFLLFMASNAAIAVLRGNRGLDALDELVPILEIFFCFALTCRVRFDEQKALKWLRWILWFVLARASWQLVLIFLGSPIIPPIYGLVDRSQVEGAISNFTYVRPIDPVAGVFVAIAFILYLFGIHRKLAVAVMGIAGTVSLLGLTRSEWIASTACFVMALVFSHRQKLLRQAFLAIFTIGVGLYSLTLAVPGFGQFIENRLVDYTVQQIENPANELQELRILEFYTAKDKFEQAPLFGQGLGSNFGTVVFNGQSLEFVQFHDYYLNLLTEAGAVGLIMLLFLAFHAAKLGIRMYGACRYDLQRAVVLCGLGSLFWWGIFFAFQPIYSSYHVTVIVGIFFGMALALTVQSKSPQAFQTADTAAVEP